MANTGRRIPLAAGNQSQPNGDQSTTGSQVADLQATEIEAAETRMRRALGLTGSSAGHIPQQRPEQARARHRFIQDGGVPVVTLHKPEPETAALRERVTSLQATLEAERAAHAATRRTLAEQQAAAQALQTRLTHNGLAHAEALEAERRLRHQAEAAATSALPEPPRPAPTPKTTTPEAAEPGDQPTATRRRTADPASSQDAPRKRGRPRVNPIPEPKPVRWWTPSFKAKNKA